MDRNFYAVAVTCLLLVLSGGCGQPTPVDDDSGNRTAVSGNSEHATDTSNAADVVEEVNLELADIAIFEEHIADFRGKVVFVDYWATWCVPCVKKFPETVELYLKYHGSDVEVISVSLDPPENESKVLKFLEKNKAGFTNILHQESDDSTAFDEHKIDGGIPFFTLYDRTGRLRYRFSLESEDIENCESPDNIDIRIRELLAE